MEKFIYFSYSTQIVKQVAWWGTTLDSVATDQIA